MQKVTIIELNGNAFHLDEGGYEQLHAYLESAAAKLAADPDRAEIMSDLEQAIAEKLRKFLGPNKTVVSAAEVAQVVTEMGPVQSNDPAADAAAPGAAAAGDSGAPGAAEAGAHRRLYQIREGAWISGVCNGIGAYFGIDVTLVRVGFVALTILTAGAWALAYIAMMFVIPYAQTSEEHAAAHGLPFTAQKLFEQAKMQHAHFTGRQWRRQWRRQRREWRAWQRQWRHGFAPAGGAWSAAPPPPSYPGLAVAGALLPLFGIVSAVLGIAFVLAILSLLFTGGILGWLPDAPRWACILGLAMLYTLVMWPLHAARRASWYAAGAHERWLGASSGAFSLVWTLVGFWLVYHYVPGVREFLHSLPAGVAELLRRLQESAPQGPRV